jgi:uncharacterized OsmC-like protein
MAKSPQRGHNATAEQIPLGAERDLTDEQRSRLLEVSEKTPVTLTLKGGIEITTSLHEA